MTPSFGQTGTYHLAIPDPPANDDFANADLKTVVNAGGTTTYNYDAADRLTGIIEPGPFTTTLGYDNANRRTSKTYPNGVVETYTPDIDGRTTRIVATKGATTLLDLEYTYTTAATCVTPTWNCGEILVTRNRPSSHDSVDSTTNYTYNKNGWLLEASTQNTSTHATISDYLYTYDANGNRTSQQVNGGAVKTLTYFGTGSVSDRVNKDSCSTVTSHTWSSVNDLGNSACTNWAYDSRNQLSSLGNTSANDAITYSGDDNTNAVVIGADSWMSDQLGVSRKLSGATSFDFLRDANGQHLGQRTASTRYYYITDLLGTVLEVTDSSGTIVNQYTYDPWGSPLTATGQTTYEIPFRFANAQWRSTGALYHMGERWYDPRDGRFTQPDPVSVFDQPTHGSQYVYASDDPVSEVDPSGLIDLPSPAGFCPWDWCPTKEPSVEGAIRSQVRVFTSVPARCTLAVGAAISIGGEVGAGYGELRAAGGVAGAAKIFRLGSPLFNAQRGFARDVALIYGYTGCPAFWLPQG